MRNIYGRKHELFLQDEIVSAVFDQVGAVEEQINFEVSKVTCEYEEIL